MGNKRLHTMQQKCRSSSPWSKWDHVRMILWNVAWLLLYKPSPRPLHAWRRLVLRSFGCNIHGRPNVYPSAIIKMPWLLTLEDESCLGDRCEIYNLGGVTLGKRSTVAQMAYLCGGTHDLSKLNTPLVVGEIMLGEDVFIGAKAIVLPGVHIADGAVIGAGSVVTRDIPEWTICVGSPCRPIKQREFEGRTSSVFEEQELG